jgi:hypothetical protein
MRKSGHKSLPSRIQTVNCTRYLNHIYIKHVTFPRMQLHGLMLSQMLMTKIRFVVGEKV